MVQSKKSCVDITAFSEYRSILMVSAALSIFLMHIICSGIYTFGSALDKMIVLWGSSGVDIFLFLSGMGIYCSLDNSHKNCGGGTLVQEQTAEGNDTVHPDYQSVFHSE